MSEVKTSFSDFHSARAHARHNELLARGGLDAANLAVNVSSVPSDVFDYIFALQKRVEEAGDMDYRKCAGLMWEELVPDAPMPLDFENRLIANLHGIDMTQHVYPLFRDGLGELIDRYSDVKSVALWSTGDIAATGYQAGKIHKSGVIQAFIASVRARFSHDQASKMIREKTRYLVDDNKFDRLLTDVEVLLNQEEYVKLVVIEDSRGNLAKVDRQVKARFGEGRVEIVPVWAAYSREGMQAAKKAQDEGSTAILEEQKRQLNALEQPEDLLDAARFGSIFSDAHVYMDFDGVIGDNLSMREEQARVIYGSLLSSMRDMGLTKIKSLV